jgi:hypothetical protein
MRRIGLTVALAVSLILAPDGAAQAQESKASEVYRIGDLGNYASNRACAMSTRSDKGCVSAAGLRTEHDH